MSESKHTPGPWHLWVDGEGAFVLRSAIGHNTMVIAKRDIGTPRSDEGIANARLMAASPELLAFVKDFAEWWRYAGSFYYGPDARQEDEGLQHIAEQASVLIAKAEGDQS